MKAVKAIIARTIYTPAEEIRDAGIIGAVLTDDRVSAELICDGIHVEPTAIRLLGRSKGIERLILVSDSLSGTGMPDGNYNRRGNFTVHVAGGLCRTVEGNLAGSTIMLDAPLRISRLIRASATRSACRALPPIRPGYWGSEIKKKSLLRAPTRIWRSSTSSFI